MNKSGKKISDTLLIILAVPLGVLCVFVIVLSGMIYKNWLDDVSSFSKSETTLQTSMPEQSIVQQDNTVSLESQEPDVSETQDYPYIETKSELLDFAVDDNIGKTARIHGYFVNKENDGYCILIDFRNWKQNRR